MRIGAARLPRGREPEADSTTQAHDRRHEKDRGIDRDHRQRRQRGGAHGLDDIEDQLREQQADHAAADREQQALRKELTGDALAAGPKRDAHGDLAATRQPAREEEIGEICAGDEQHATDRTQQHPQRRAHVAHRPRVDTDDPCRTAGFAGKLPHDIRRDRIEVGLRLCDGHPFVEPADH